MTRFRTASIWTVFGGQSMAITGGAPASLMQNFPNDPYKIVAEGGLSVTLLAGHAAARLHPYAHVGRKNVLILVAPGYGDIKNELDLGLVLYNDQVSYANDARTAGFDFVISSTLTPSTDFNIAMDTQRIDANNRLVADASNAFDGVADLANVAGLNDINNATYYADSVHWTAAGGDLAAATLLPVYNAVRELALAS